MIILIGLILVAIIVFFIKWLDFETYHDIAIRELIKQNIEEKITLEKILDELEKLEKNK